MLQFNKKGQVTNLVMNDLYIIEKWTKEFLIEIKEVENQLCKCKSSILKIKWHEIIYWFNSMAQDIIQDNTVSVESFIQGVTNVIKKYENYIYQDKTMALKTYSIFRELHKVTTNEFLTVCKEKIIQYNDGDIPTIELLNFIGEQLYKVLINTIFELNEIMLNCEYNPECTNHEKLESESIRFLINDLYNVNSYSIYKLEKFVELLDMNTENVDFIADFKYFDEPSLNPNLIKMLEQARSIFKSLTITNLNIDIQNILCPKFKNEIAK